MNGITASPSRYINPKVTVVRGYPPSLVMMLPAKIGPRKPKSRLELKAKLVAVERTLEVNSAAG